MGRTKLMLQYCLLHPPTRAVGRLRIMGCIISEVCCLGNTAEGVAAAPLDGMLRVTLEDSSSFASTVFSFKFRYKCFKRGGVWGSVENEIYKI